MAWWLSVLPHAHAGWEEAVIFGLRDQWERVEAWCAGFLLTVHADEGTVALAGRQCQDTRGRWRTELDGPDGPLVEVRDLDQVWRFDPRDGVIVHVRRAGEQPPEELKPTSHADTLLHLDPGDVITLFEQGTAFENLGFRDLGAREVRLFSATLPEGDTAFVFVDRASGLPTAWEQRTADGELVLTWQLDGLVVLDELPDAWLRIDADAPHLELKLPPEAP